MGEDRPGQSSQGSSGLNPALPPHQFYGRRIGHRLRPRQERLIADLLPTVRLDPREPRLTVPAQLFDPPVATVELEIGFGGGERLAQAALRHRDTGFIGIEPFVNGVAKLLAAIDDNRLANVRIFDGDARDLLPAIGPATLAAIHLLFPDPWPKRRHRRRRLLQPDMVTMFHRLLTPDGEVRFATDIGDYAADALLAMNLHGGFEWTAERAADWREPPPDWTPTRYETKARAAGRPAIHLGFRKKRE